MQQLQDSCLILELYRVNHRCAKSNVTAVGRNMKLPQARADVAGGKRAEGGKGRGLRHIGDQAQYAFVLFTVEMYG